MRFLYVLLAFFSTALISTTNAHNSVALIQKDTLQDLLDFADKLNSDYINGDGSFFIKILILKNFVNLTPMKTLP